MFSELIYTRCRQGVDILKEGRPITSDGFKVYSCTPALMKDGNIDLPFLFNAAQGKQPYHDPDFMDNAYLYFVPDKGENFMLEFHPLPFDAAATGDYSHRPGNFLNHILVGNFCDFYPFELFRDKAVWNAKSRGEAYYYQNTPDTLPAHGEVKDPAGQIGVDEIARFIADGRKEALKKAVSFLIAQYDLPPEERKFLVIHDESTEKVEMWIAAIECAFSPRMAAALPFATRLEKFVMANRYTIDQSGTYQMQINLQDPKQKQRFRAMIVGVDDRDKTSVAAARPLANSPFVLLDGIKKDAAFEADISSRYYDFITSFDDSHTDFCREFLQMLDIQKPGAELCRFFDVYMVLENASALPNAETTAKALSALANRMLKTKKLVALYKRITEGLPRFLQENPYNALQIIKWLQSISQIIGDKEAKQRLTGIVCKAFSEQIYKKADAEGAFSFWEGVKNSEFATDVAKDFTASKTINDHNADLSQFKKPGRVNFTLIYLECAAFLGTLNTEELKKIVNFGLKSCAGENDFNEVQKILKALSLNKQVDVQNMLFAILKESDQGHAGFFVDLLIKSNAAILTDNVSMYNFIKKLETEKVEKPIAVVLLRRISTVSRAEDIDKFIDILVKIKSVGNADLIKIYQTLDGKLNFGEKGSEDAALSIQHEKPKEAHCVKSAHIYALEVLNDKKERAQIKNIYGELSKQGFPSEKNSAYVHELAGKLIKAQLNKDELTYFLKLFARVQEYLRELIRAILEVTTAKQKGEWNTLMDLAMETKNQAICDIIIAECAELKQAEKALAQLYQFLVSEETQKYFMPIGQKVLEKIEEKKSHTGLGRLTSWLKGNNADKKEKK